MELIPRTYQNRHEYKRLNVYGWLAAAAAAIVAVVIIFTALFFAVGITDSGMAPTLDKGDVILFSRLGGFVTAPRRSDIVAFKKDGAVSLGRIAALPGETVQVLDGRIYIDGLLLDESQYASGSCSFEDTVLEEGTYLVMPDSRENMEISDTADLILSGNDIMGTAFLRVAPIYRIAFFK